MGKRERGQKGMEKKDKMKIRKERVTYLVSSVTIFKCKKRQYINTKYTLQNK